MMVQWNDYRVRPTAIKFTFKSNNINVQGVVTHIESVELLATRIKMESRDQHVNLH